MSFRPSFEKGLILKHYMLEALRDYPYNYVNTLYSNRGDGVILGMDVSFDEQGNICIKEGVVKIDGDIYFLTQEVFLQAEEDENTYVYLEIAVSEMVDGEEWNIDIVQRKEEDNGKFELFRYFKRKDGELKEYRDVKELCEDKTENRLNQTNTPKSVVGGTILCDRYLKMFAKHILHSSNANMSDISFAYQCLNGIENIDVVKTYLGEENLSNKVMLELIKKRAEELNQTRIEEKIVEPKKRAEPKMIIS